MSDSGEKTEQATEKRMREVRSKGQLSKSQDLTAWLGIGAAAVMTPVTVGLAAQAGTGQMLNIRMLIARPDPDLAVQMLGESLGSMAGILTPMLATVFVVVLGGAVAQGGVHFKRVAGKYEQFNLVTGLGRTFGGQAVWQGVKALLKTIAVGVVLTLVIQGLTPVLMTAGGLPVTALIDAATGGAVSLVQSAVIAGLVLAAADVFVVMKRNRKRTRMTKKEVTDENKSSEGDPQVKSQRRSRQLAMSRNRMIASVATADVVLVNPTHFAVALRYEPGKSAPRVVAKGAGVIAARIREQAETDGVPIVRDIPLARALHSACDLGQEIPIELYNAVARVLAFVLALKARGSGASTGVHTMNDLAPASGGLR
ncbi:EscU/YscU/HrcU family type III secretion system export apparatus switch protein [Cryobacterium sp. TmT2-59]|uniref:EscU/YscU/HrcU family type III secretion system export apparatus switch protein n=1 Tax=Cryobacterium shii TaxID=1259235 RepID=A0AAQ2HGM9_9MICO|nr:MULTISPECIES: EscU/YscU/HrcU family type III secretion system export apparatus switch protein [Cryobacterium]TFC52091.1 EscU/YscU/HrcU family type III secretion system export apparatus switch protein [Cryobacterium shii]TFC84644.1 EscU/YscU/HrcU family type III secretion system export apparatus switch protein [Cryobacterium sp. TmT2-59]TFD16237.1 EscU/YscU/HrcU family type III secretion system export apparatus switch protein [Cryobacterium sp. TMT2-23]TFD19040.1 EscU/YscU/HrcU family type II